MWPLIILSLLGVGGYVATRPKAPPAPPKNPSLVPPPYVPPAAVKTVNRLTASSSVKSTFRLIRPAAAPPNVQTIQPAPFAPIQIGGDPLTPNPGSSYAAVVTTNGLANSASASQVGSKASSLGFSNAVVTKTRPPGFPGNAQGDWYVTAIYTGSPGQKLARNNGNMFAGATVVDVWQIG